jgi:hypothetical protein
VIGFYDLKIGKSVKLIETEFRMATIIRITGYFEGGAHNLFGKYRSISKFKES